MKKILFILLFLPAFLNAQIKDRTKQFDHTIKATTVTVSTGDSSLNIANTAWVKRQLYGSGGGSSNPFADNTDLLKNSSDNTKLFRISLSGLTTGTTRTWTLPDVNGTFARIDAAQSFTGVQTFGSAPVFSSLNTSGGIHYGNGSGATLQTGAGTLTTLLHGGTSPAYSGVAIADFTATGTPSSTTYLRGDNTWATLTAITSSDTAAITSRAWRTNGNNMAGVTGLFGTTSNDNITIITNGTTKGFISASGTFVWNAASATAGFKVDLRGRTQIFTSPTGQNELLIDDDGVNGQNATIVMNPSGTNNKVLLLTALNDNIITGRVYGSSTDGFAIGGRNGSATVGYFGINNSVAISATSGAFYSLQASNTFNPTSGTATLFLEEDARTINQTGGANGITRGSYMHPTLTAAADYRPYENTVGNNFFNSTSGNTGIGLSSAASAKLHVSGSFRVDLGSDATGDLYYRNATPTITRLGIGSTGDVLTVAGGVPSWAAPAGATTLYNGDGTISANRTVTGSTRNLTFTGIGSYNIFSTDFTFAKTDGTIKYTGKVGAFSDNFWQLGYLKGGSVGVALRIDTNNNVIAGGTYNTTYPLYATGSALFVGDGFVSRTGNYYSVRSITTNTTIDLTYNFMTIDATSGNVTITLPAASTAFGGTVGIDYIFQRIDNSGNTITISRAGSDLINGATTFTLGAQWDSKKLRCTSTTTWGIY